jgi:hypothetical protein
MMMIIMITVFVVLVTTGVAPQQSIADVPGPQSPIFIDSINSVGVIIITTTIVTMRL